MISVSHLYVQDDQLEESIGAALALGGGLALLGLIIAIGQGQRVRELEDALVEAYSDEYLTMELEIDEDAIDNSILSKIFDKLRLSGRFKEKILSENGLSLIVNKRAAAYMKQKFGKYPMFKIIGSDQSYEADYDKFMRDHQRLFDGIFSTKLQRAAENENLPDNIRINAEWLHQALRPFLYTNDLTENVVKKVKIQAKKFQTVSFDN